jgi:hypothetical protein
MHCSYIALESSGRIIGHVITTQSKPTAISVMLTCTHAGTVGLGIGKLCLSVFFARAVAEIEVIRAMKVRKRLNEGISNTLGSK